MRQLLEAHKGTFYESLPESVFGDVLGGQGAGEPGMKDAGEPGMEGVGR